MLRYFLSPEEYRLAPPIYEDCRVTTFINGPAYFEALSEDLQRIGRNSQSGENKSHFVYIAGFVLNWLQPGYPFMVPGSKGMVRFFDLLVEKARAGVDVRVLAWVPWTLGLAGKLDLRPESGDNMRTIHALRQEPALAKKACLNIVSHPAGSAHAKLVLIGTRDWAAGYSGGIDLSPDRAEPNWLDVQAKVEGPAVQDLFNFFRDMWNQNMIFGSLSSNGRNGHTGRFPRPFRPIRPSFFSGRGGEVAGIVPGTPIVEERKIPAAKRGVHQVQSLRTLPVFKFARNPLLYRLRVAPLDYAPQGAFEVHAALYKGIFTAERYIYIEDQYFWAKEVLEWINAALRRRPSLRVILATGESEQLGERMEAYRVLAVQESLLSTLSEKQRQQVLFVKRKEMVHAKTILVDDCWAMVGSANIARRSLFTDIEHTLAIGDPNGDLVRAYRAALWGNRLGIPAGSQGQLLQLDRGLNLWNPGWGTPWEGSNGANPFQTVFEQKMATLKIDPEWYSMVEDPDSRHSWYFPIRRTYTRYLT